MPTQSSFEYDFVLFVCRKQSSSALLLSQNLVQVNGGGSVHVQLAIKQLFHLVMRIGVLMQHVSAKARCLGDYLGSHTVSTDHALLTNLLINIGFTGIESVMLHLMELARLSSCSLTEWAKS